MTRLELQAALKAAGVSTEEYWLDGGLGREGYVLCQAPAGKWITYYSEMGERRGLRWFDSEAEACCDLLARLRKTGPK